MIQVEDFHKEILYTLKYLNMTTAVANGIKRCTVKSYNDNAQKASDNKYSASCKGLHFQQCYRSYKLHLY